jgi:hypothetical protein
MQYRVNDIIRKHALRAAINHLQQTSDLCWWMTFTFVENVVERKYAHWKWDVLSKRIMKHWPGTRAVGVWARQLRGAWHVHLVAHIPGVTDLDVKGNVYNGSGGSENWQWLRAAAVDLKWGQQMEFRRIGDSSTDGAKLANYLGNYCTDKNGLDPVKDRSVRRLIYLGKNVRIFDMHWKSAFKRIVALGRAEHRSAMSGMNVFEEHMAIYTYKKNAFESWGDRYRRLVPYWFALGWGLMNEPEQQTALCEDRFTRDYLEEGKISYL